MTPEPDSYFTFDHYFEWLIPWEGSVYENDPNDPGGATNYGIDQASHPDVNIRALTAAEAKEIYRVCYWAKVRADELPPKVAWAVMDAAVNCGPARAAKWLQRAGGVAQDGWIGVKTLAAARESDDTLLASEILDFREAYYRDLGEKRQFKSFLRGWLNRNNSLREVLSR